MSKQKLKYLQILFKDSLRLAKNSLEAPLSRFNRRLWRSRDLRLPPVRDCTALSVCCTSLTSFQMTTRAVSSTVPTSYSKFIQSCWSQTDPMVHVSGLRRGFLLRLSLGFMSVWVLKIVCDTLWNMMALCAVWTLTLTLGDQGALMYPKKPPQPGMLSAARWRKVGICMLWSLCIPGPSGPAHHTPTQAASRGHTSPTGLTSSQQGHNKVRLKTSMQDQT